MAGDKSVGDELADRITVLENGDVQMGEILRDLSPAAISRAMDANRDDFWLWFHRSPAVQTAWEERGVTWFESGLVGPLLSTAWRAYLAPETADARIEEMKARFRSRKLILTWWVNSDPHPADLGKRLEAHGFVGKPNRSGVWCLTCPRSAKTSSPIPPDW